MPKANSEAFDSQLYRAWRYFRDGYALYVNKPLGIINFLTVTYYLLVERISGIEALFPSFTIYAVVALLVFLPLSTLFGWVHMRRSRIYGTESVLASVSNPVIVHSNRVGMESTLIIFKALKIEPTKDWWELYNFWCKHDQTMGWKPT